MSDTRAPGGYFGRLSEPGVVIALATGSFYLTGVSYYNSYFRRLSIPELEFDLAPQRYITTGFLIAAVLMVLGFSAAHYFAQKNRKVIDTFYMSIILVSSGGGVLDVWLNSRILTFRLDWLQSLLILVVLVFFVIMAVVILLKQNIPQFNDLSSRAALLLFVLVGITSSGSIAGNISADNLLDNPGTENLVVLEFTDEKLYGSPRSHPSVLLAHAGGFFYILEPNEKARPTVYAIPESNVRSVLFNPQ